MALTGRFVALLVIGIVPIVLIGRPAVLGGWLLLLGAVASVDLMLAASPRQLTLERAQPGVVRLGETVQTLLHVTNGGRRRMRAIVRDGWEPSAGATPSRQEVSIPVAERRTLGTLLTPLRRGSRRSDQVTVRSFGPLGLVARQITFRSVGTLTVLPPFNARKHLPSRLARLRELDGMTSVMVRGQGTEFDSLRDYVRGDDVRSIDWRATARRREPSGAANQQLVVRTWRPERDRRVVIIIDSGRTSAARIENEPRIDTAFESALLLAALASRAGDRVDLVIFDRRVRGRVQSASSTTLINRMVTTMAPINPELIEMDWSAVPALVRSVTSHRALVVLATSADTPGASRGLLAVLPELTKRHRVIVSSVLDPSVVAATAKRDNRSAVYRAAAAERTLLDTARVAAAIRQSGADVVTAPPTELPPALADRYLALKAAGQL